MNTSGFIHGDTVCTECGDDAELHELKRAFDLIHARRQDEVSEAGWQAVENALEASMGGAGVAMDAF